MLDSVPNPIFVECRVPERSNAPEARLMLAVLQDALATFQRGLRTSSCKELQAFREVDRWFRCRDADAPFSFESICGTLLLDPHGVREGLNRLQREALLDRTLPGRRRLQREHIFPTRVTDCRLPGR